MPTIPEATTGDRRPIASRDTALARRLTACLVDRRVAPDTISIVGMFAALIAGAALATTPAIPAAERWLWLLAAVAVQLRLLCNLLDGMVAVAAQRTSTLGELYNDLPDRVSDSAVLVGLGCAGSMPWLGFTAALLAMATAYVRTLGRALGAGSDFGGPMAKPQRMFLVTVVALYLALAPAAWRPQWHAAGLPELALAVIVLGAGWTAMARLRRIAKRLQIQPR
jgi:phosphatidylglycerophosphate synthase